MILMIEILPYDSINEIILPYVSMNEIIVIHVEMLLFCTSNDELVIRYFKNSCVYMNEKFYFCI